MTTTRSELGFALFAVTTVIVGGGLWLLSWSGASVRGSDTNRKTSGSPQWTAAATAADAFATDDDDVRALPAAPTMLTADHGHARELITMAFGEPSSRRSNVRPSRGPPDQSLAGPANSFVRHIDPAGAPAWTAGEPQCPAPNPSDDNPDIEDRDDEDGGDDDGDGPLIVLSAVLTDNHGQSCSLILAGFDAPFSLASIGHPVRAPPL